MNIEELTIGQAREIAGMFPAKSNAFGEPHPLERRRVVAVLPHGFIHFGTLSVTSNGYVLTDASNLRYWEKRNDGLPEFARSGPKSGDRIDKIGTVYINSALFFYPCGDWS